MKNIFIKMIDLYQITPFHCHSMCRYTPTCSEYMKIAISEHGSFKGVFMGIKRILRCNPFGGFGIDNVPENVRKKHK